MTLRERIENRTLELQHSIAELKAELHVLERKIHDAKHGVRQER